MIKNPIRQEVTFTLVEGETEHEFVVRPTFARISAIEARFGPAFPLSQRIGRMEIGVKEICDLVATILKGEPGAPDDKTIAEWVYARGAYTYVVPIVLLLNEATKAGQPEEPAAPGN